MGALHRFEPVRVQVGSGHCVFVMGVGLMQCGWWVVNSVIGDQSHGMMHGLLPRRTLRIMLSCSALRACCSADMGCATSVILPARRKEGGSLEGRKVEGEGRPRARRGGMWQVGGRKQR